MAVVTRTLRSEDVDPLAEAFASWPKSRRVFEAYARRVAEDDLDAVVAVVGPHLVGYLLIEPTSSYPPFAAAGIPEIADFNVLRPWQRKGIGKALMNEAERRAGRTSDVVGLGVGLCSDYGTAQRLYVRRGYVPDGAGLVLAGAPVPRGTRLTLDDGPELKFTKRLRG